VVTQDELESVASTLEIKKANLLAAKASLVLAEDDLKNTTIEAPMDGWIGRSSYTLGNYITPSSGVLATIIHVDRMRVRFSISNRDFLSGFGTVKRLGEDGVVRITLADGSEYPVKGEVEFVNNEANERTDSIQVYASLANPDRKLIAGGAVTVTLAQSRGKMLPAVLPSAVMHDSRGSYVYVVGPGNKAEKRSVVLGSSRTDLQIIKSGIEVGTLVIVDGTHKAVDGAEVEPIRQER
jgi:RND family efflux transporter MFP subunit